MAMTRSSGFKVGMGIAVAALAGSQQAAAQAPTLSVTLRDCPASVPSTRAFNRTMWKWSRSPADGSGSLTRSASAPRLAALIIPGMSRRAQSRPLRVSGAHRPVERAAARLAAALAPAYMRVSGTWANSTYFAESDDAPATPPNGFRAVLSRERWKAVIDFAHAANAEIVTSMATAPVPGTQQAGGRAIRRVACSPIPDPSAAELPPPSS